MIIIKDLIFLNKDFHYNYFNFIPILCLYYVLNHNYYLYFHLIIFDINYKDVLLLFIMVGLYLMFILFE
jgi:hypothetical protein